MAIFILAAYMISILIRPMDWWEPLLGYELVTVGAVLILLVGFPQLLARFPVLWKRVPQLKTAIGFLLAEDWDMWVRIAQSYDIRSSPQLLVKHRWHDKNFSNSSAKVNLTNELVFLKRIFSTPHYQKRHFLKRHTFSTRYLAAAWQVLQENNQALARRYLIKSAICFPLVILTRPFLAISKKTFYTSKTQRHPNESTD